MSLKSALDKFGADGNIDAAELKSLKMDYFSDAGYKKFAQEMQIHQRRRGLKVDGSKRTFRPPAALEAIDYQQGGMNRWNEFKKLQSKRLEEAGGPGQWDWKAFEKSAEGKAAKEAAMRGEPIGSLQFNTTSNPTDDNFEPEFQVSYISAAQPQKDSAKNSTTYTSNVQPIEFDDFKIERQDVSAIDKKYSLDKIQARIDETTKNALPSPKPPKLNYKPREIKQPSFKQLRKEARKTLKKDVAFNPDPLKVSMLPDQLIKQQKIKNLGPKQSDRKKSANPMGNINPKFTDYDAKGKWQAPAKISKEFKR